MKKINSINDQHTQKNNYSFGKFKYLINMKAPIAPKKTTVPTETKRDIVKLFRVLCSCDRCKFVISPVSVSKKSKTSTV